MHIQAFAVVVVGRVFTVCDTVIVAARNHSHTVAGTAVRFVAVPIQTVALADKVLLETDQRTGNAVVVQIRINNTVVFTQRQRFIFFINFAALYALFKGQLLTFFLFQRSGRRKHHTSTIGTGNLYFTD